LGTGVSLAERRQVFACGLAAWHRARRCALSCRLHALRAAAATAQAKDKRKGRDTKGASTVSSGVRLENVAKARAPARDAAQRSAPHCRCVALPVRSRPPAPVGFLAVPPQSFKGSDVLKDINWEVKKGERVGLVGWNGAGKTTQLKLITGEMEPDGGAIVRAKANMKIAFLTQEFEVVMTRTVRAYARGQTVRRGVCKSAWAYPLTHNLHTHNALLTPRYARSFCPRSTTRCA
jgi:ABC-type glutathione transport system ATPase component